MTLLEQYIDLLKNHKNYQTIVNKHKKADDKVKAILNEQLIDKDLNKIKNSQIMQDHFVGKLMRIFVWYEYSYEFCVKFPSVVPIDSLFNIGKYDR